MKFALDRLPAVKRTRGIGEKIVGTATLQIQHAEFACRRGNQVQFEDESKARVCDKRRRFSPTSCAGVATPGAFNYEHRLNIAAAARGDDSRHRSEFLQLVRVAKPASALPMQKPEAAYHCATFTGFTDTGSETLACSNFAIR
jgi:hypothetical protein